MTESHHKFSATVFKQRLRQAIGRHFPPYGGNTRIAIFSVGQGIRHHSQSRIPQIRPGMSQLFHGGSSIQATWAVDRLARWMGRSSSCRCLRKVHSCTIHNRSSASLHRLPGYRSLSSGQHLYNSRGARIDRWQVFLLNRPAAHPLLQKKKQISTRSHAQVS